jgi:cytochrome P450
MQPFRTEHPLDNDVDISSVAFWRRSFDERDAAFARLRSERPVSWHPALETPGFSKKRHHEAGFWAVTRAADIGYVSRRHALFSSSIGQVNLRPAPYRLQPNMLVMDPPLHSAYRTVVSRAFTPRSVEAMRRTIERRAKQIVARAAVAGDFDFVAQVSAQLPLRTIADLLGVPDSERERFVTAADAYTSTGYSGRTDAGGGMERYFAEQSEYLRALCAALARLRRTSPADDLMTHLVQGRIDERPFTDEEIFSTMILLVVAGDETTKQAITLSFLALEAHPEQRDWLMADFDARIDSAFEELVRFASPVLAFTRTATSETELGDVTIAEGDKVALFYCSGNRDEAAFDHPERLELARPKAGNVAFGGGGVHFCLGAAVAKIQLAAVIREVFTRLRIELVGEAVPLFSEFTHGVVSLPVRAEARRLPRASG